MNTKPKRTSKSGYRGLQPRTVDNIAKMRAALKPEPDIGLEAIAANLGWPYPKALAVWQIIRPDFKKVWVHRDDHPEFFNPKPASSPQI